MVFQHILVKKAEEDVLETFIWYQQKHEGLGDEFLLSLEAEINAICRNPFGFQIQYMAIRMVTIRRFPLGIHYIIDGNKVVIIAVLHFSRNPKTIKKRIA